MQSISSIFVVDSPIISDVSVANFQPLHEQFKSMISMEHVMSTEHVLSA